MAKPSISRWPAKAVARYWLTCSIVGRDSGSACSMAMATSRRGAGQLSGRGSNVHDEMFFPRVYKLCFSCRQAGKKEGRHDGKGSSRGRQVGQ